MKTIALVAGLLAAGALWAHHSVTAVFDTQKHIKLTGELTEVEWVNPHIFLHVKGKTEGGTVQAWKVEGGPPAWYRRVNVNKATFTKRIGQQVSLDGYPSKVAAEPYGYFLKITFADGDSLESISAAEASGKGK